jgi:hypothetical protein
VSAVEATHGALDRGGLENRKWAYHKLQLSSELRAAAAMSVRALDRAKDLQGDLMDASDVEDVLLAVEELGDVFNKVNCSTALHRVARLCTTPAAAGSPRPDVAAVAHDERFRALLAMVERSAHEMEIVSISNTLWAFARLRLRPSDATVSTLASRAVDQCADAEPRHLSTVMWALAVLGHEPRSRLLAAVGDRAGEVAASFRPPDVVNLLWAYARWHRGCVGGCPGSEGLVASLAPVAVKRALEYTPYQCANLAWSLAMLDAMLPPRVVRVIIDRAASDAEGLDDVALTRTLWVRRRTGLARAVALAVARVLARALARALALASRLVSSHLVSRPALRFFLLSTRRSLNVSTGETRD